jgi:hypothetical protein
MGSGLNSRWGSSCRELHSLFSFKICVQSPSKHSANFSRMRGSTAIVTFSLLGSFRGVYEATKTNAKAWACKHGNFNCEDCLASRACFAMLPYLEFISVSYHF